MVTEAMTQKKLFSAGVEVSATSPDSDTLKGLQMYNDNAFTQLSVPNFDTHKNG